MLRAPKEVVLSPDEAGAERLRDALGLAGPFVLDTTCGDVVLEVPDRAPGELRLDGRRLPPGRRALLGGEELRFGRRRVRLRAPEPRAAAAGTRTLARGLLGARPLAALVPGPALVVLEGPAAGRRWPLSPGRHLLGRGLDADVVLDHPSISRHHAVLEVDANVVRIRDAGSRHGVRVGHARVRRPRRLRPGDELLCGAVRMRYVERARPLPPRSPWPVERWLLAGGAVLLLAGAMASAAGLLL